MCRVLIEDLSCLDVWDQNRSMALCTFATTCVWSNTRNCWNEILVGKVEPFRSTTCEGAELGIMTATKEPTALDMAIEEELVKIITELMAIIMPTMAVGISRHRALPLSSKLID